MEGGILNMVTLKELFTKLCFGIAELNVNTCCFFYIHQPKPPSKLEKFRKYK